VLLVALILGSILTFHIVGATTFIENDITVDTVWTKEGSPYIITRSITIRSNATLRVEPGVEIRIPAGITINVRGTLVIEGTEKEPVKIIQQGTGNHWAMAIGSRAKVEVRNTEIPEGIAIISITDSNVSFNNILGNITIKRVPGIENTISGSIVLFNNTKGNIYIADIYGSKVSFTNIRGNITIGTDIMGKNIKDIVYVSGSNVSFTNIRGNITVGGQIVKSSVLFNDILSQRIITNIIDNSELVISNSTIAHGSGVRIDYVYRGSRVIIKFSNIYGNKPYGLIIYSGFILAENNWWGDPSGPYHDSINPTGKGDAIKADPNNIDFVPWLEQPVGGNKPPIASLRVEPSIPVVGEEVVFDARESYDPDGNITLYLFDFGDGVSTGWTTAPLMRHTYKKPGTYNTTLLVYDDRGLVSKHVVTITVVKERPSTTTTTTLVTTTTATATEISHTLTQLTTSKSTSTPLVTKTITIITPSPTTVTETFTQISISPGGIKIIPIIDWVTTGIIALVNSIVSLLIGLAIGYMIGKRRK